MNFGPTKNVLVLLFCSCSVSSEEENDNESDYSIKVAMLQNLVRRQDVKSSSACPIIQVRPVLRFRFGTKLGLHDFDQLWQEVFERNLVLDGFQ
jgi:hypothetical protein